MATDASEFLLNGREYPRFSRAEETRLAEQAHAGCVESRNQLVLSQVPWVLMQVGRKWHHNRDDAVGEAMLQLVMAIEKFNPSKGRLTTYANYAALSAGEASRSYYRAFPAGTTTLEAAAALVGEFDTRVDTNDMRGVILGRIAKKFGSHVGQICEMRLCQKMTYKEIGVVLGVTKQWIGAIWLRVQEYVKTIV